MLSLTGHALLVLLVLLAVGAPALTVLAWSRVPGPTALRAGQRFGMIVGCQVTALLLVGALINNYFYFYSSWNDLLGRTKVGHISTVGAIPRTPTGEAQLIDVARRSGTPAPGGGVVLSQRFVSKKLGLSTPAVVYLPPQYFEPAYAHTRFPVAIVFPGYPGNPPIYFTQLPISRIMQQEVAAGRAKPFIAVVVKESVVAPRDTECANVVHGPQVETFLGEEVRQQIQHVLRTRTDRQGWALVGSSTGGFCAVKMAMRHPDLYGSAIGLSGYYKALLDNTTGALYAGSQRIRDENSPLWRLAHLPAPNIGVLATISKQERTYPQTVALMHAAKPPLRLSTIVSPTGGHNPHTYGAVLPQAFDWLSQQFELSGATGPASSPSGSPTTATGVQASSPR